MSMCVALDAEHAMSWAMDANTPVDSAVTLTAYKKMGRKPGSLNYGRKSYLSRRMYERGIKWADEIIDAYLLYKRQVELIVAGQSTVAADPALLYFWTDALPYVSLKLIERETRGHPPKRKPKRFITPGAMQALADAEGRKL